MTTTTATIDDAPPATALPAPRGATPATPAAPAARPWLASRSHARLAHLPDSTSGNPHPVAMHPSGEVALRSLCGFLCDPTPADDSAERCHQCLRAAETEDWLNRSFRDEGWAGILDPAAAVASGLPDCATTVVGQPDAPADATTS